MKKQKKLWLLLIEFVLLTGVVTIAGHTVATRHILLAQTVQTDTPTPIPNCTDAAPGSAPQLLSALTKGTTQVTLTWSPASDPVSYYLVAYGTAPGKYIYGNVYVGGHDTTSYTVGRLSPKTTYYFVVRAGNGCQPGEFSDEIASTTGPFITNAPPTDTPIPQDTPTPTPFVATYQNYPQHVAQPTQTTKITTSGLIAQKAQSRDLWAIFRTILIIIAVLSILATLGLVGYFKLLRIKSITPLEEMKKEETTPIPPKI